MTSPLVRIYFVLFAYLLVWVVRIRTFFALVSYFPEFGVLHSFRTCFESVICCEKMLADLVPENKYSCLNLPQKLFLRETRGGFLRVTVILWCF